ncbi:sigma-70 family RNA polymerase sigma factor [Micromonospora endophytica]|uniref:RNA polymerase subunit sigma-24 n=1 Tax=Micromonospora endophytica TaxID=515350 RepID=A0A2W2CN03_9ACTN|nr:sigma-70 family RNA polymerase sigma factor [Micromonospora endophytica]PZG00922.1 RNA polymerase subunit sigma-24 [Micromonospora endophytica]RIW46260.1 sigma-70 family RNA polymerase sigma factor [Micromonospora endophytica]BCJ61782.1 hypothetical protein Jiend_52040 [Micromonospora endophytica]
MSTETPVRSDGLPEFLAARARLLAIAQHIAGRHADAEDIVQDAWLRWQRVDRSIVDNPPAFLSLTTCRLSISAIRSARRRPSVPAGDWLENLPVPDEDPARLAERAEDVRTAVALLASLLTPLEQVAYLLREAFGWPYRQIGTALDRTDGYARQLTYRARSRLAAARDCAVPPRTPDQRSKLLTAFLHASRTGDMTALVALTEK